MTKTCTACGATKPATTEHFFAEKRGKYGVRAKCKDCFMAASKEWKRANRARVRANKRRRYHANADRHRAEMRARYHREPEYHRKRARRWREENPERAKAKDRAWAEENPEKAREKWRRASERRKRDRRWTLSNRISRAIARSLDGGKRGRPWESLVGYSVDDLTAHLEAQFQPGMTWENRGEWHIDHIIPLSAFNYTKPEHPDFRRAWALSNLRPLWAKENMSKGARLERPFQPSLKLEVA